jgi:hypothetical protein
MGISINLIFLVLMTYSKAFLQSNDPEIIRFDQEVKNLQKTTQNMCTLIDYKMIFQAKKLISYLSNSQCNGSDAQHNIYLRGR